MTKRSDLSEASAVLSFLPAFSGDGYGYGGSAIVTIGDRSFLFGEDYDSRELAKEIVSRWNAGGGENA